MSDFSTYGGSLDACVKIAKRLKLDGEAWEYMEEPNAGHAIWSLNLPWDKINIANPTSDDDPGCVTMTRDHFDELLAKVHLLGYEYGVAEERQHTQKHVAEVIALLKRRDWDI